MNRTATLQSKDTYTTFARILAEEFDVPVAKIHLDARLAEDLGLSSYMDADNVFADITDRFGLDYWTVARGLHRHYEDPVKTSYERDTKAFAGEMPSVHPPLRALSALEPITVADAVSILDAGRYLCRAPVLGLEEAVRRLAAWYARLPKGAEPSDDTRVREDLGFDWNTFNRLLAAIDYKLEGAFCSSRRGMCWGQALLAWEVAENIAGADPIRMGDIIATARENRWTQTGGTDWRTDVPAIQEGRRLTEEELFRTIQWLLVPAGYPFRSISRGMPLGDHIQQGLLARLHGVLGERFVVSDEVFRRISGSTAQVADVIRFAQGDPYAPTAPRNSRAVARPQQTRFGRYLILFLGFAAVLGAFVLFSILRSFFGGR